MNIYVYTKASIKLYLVTQLHLLKVVDVYKQRILSVIMKAVNDTGEAERCREDWRPISVRSVAHRPILKIYQALW